MCLAFRARQEKPAPCTCSIKPVWPACPAKRSSPVPRDIGSSASALPKPMPILRPPAVESNSSAKESNDLPPLRALVPVHAAENIPVERLRSDGMQGDWFDHLLFAICQHAADD